MMTYPCLFESCDSLIQLIFKLIQLICIGLLDTVLGDHITGIREMNRLRVLLLFKTSPIVLCLNKFVVVMRFYVEFPEFNYVGYIYLEDVLNRFKVLTLNQLLERKIQMGQLYLDMRIL